MTRDDAAKERDRLRKAAKNYANAAQLVAGMGKNDSAADVRRPQPR